MLRKVPVNPALRAHPLVAVCEKSSATLADICSKSVPGAPVKVTCQVSGTVPATTATLPAPNMALSWARILVAVASGVLANAIARVVAPWAVRLNS